MYIGQMYIGQMYIGQMYIRQMYIGQTDGNLITRFNKHNIDSPLRQESDVAKHQVDNPNHKIDFNNCAISDLCGPFFLKIYVI